MAFSAALIDYTDNVFYSFATPRITYTTFMDRLIASFDMMPRAKSMLRWYRGTEMFTQWKQSLVKFVQSEDGPTAVEYAVMLALIIVVCITAITTLGNNANTTFKTVGTKLAAASS